MLLDYVRQLEGIPKQERKQLILKTVSNLGYSPTVESYSHHGLDGENIIISIGKGKEVLAVTHYDTVPGSPGANDNCSTIAVMFDVLKGLRHYKPKGCLKLCIFDHEEIGCVGSRAYVRSHGVAGIKAVYDMELVGMGDMLGIWPVSENDRESQALRNLINTIEKLGYHYETEGRLPGFFGDYEPFKEVGADAFCISVVFRKDKEAIRSFVKTPRLLLVPRVMLGLRIPRMFRLYHSPDDRSEHLNEGALKMTSDVLYYALVNMDR
jgi:Zn-dependent M28 family amino/carboxypeptidase